MIMDENSISQNNNNQNTNDIPLYAESRLTRQQAINEFADVILCSNMKPKYVKYALELIQKCLPIENTLPTTIEELFGAMISSENDWRLAQYLVKHKQCPSFVSSSSSSRNLSNENTNSIQSLSSLFLYLSRNPELNSDEENELSPYDRLQRSLQPITDMARDLNPYYPLSIPNHTNLLSFDQGSQTGTTVIPSLKRLFSESSSTVTTTHTNSSPRIPTNSDDDSDDEIFHPQQKLSCFEVNGCDLLNGGKRRRYE